MDVVVGGFGSNSDTSNGVPENKKQDKKDKKN